MMDLKRQCDPASVILAARGAPARRSLSLLNQALDPFRMTAADLLRGQLDVETSGLEAAARPQRWRCRSPA